MLPSGAFTTSKLGPKVYFKEPQKTATKVVMKIWVSEINHFSAFISTRQLHTDLVKMSRIKRDSQIKSFTPSVCKVAEQTPVMHTQVLARPQTALNRQRLQGHYSPKGSIDIGVTCSGLLKSFTGTKVANGQD